jgi:hypothetical protein
VYFLILQIKVTELSTHSPRAHSFIILLIVHGVSGRQGRKSFFTLGFKIIKTNIFLLIAFSSRLTLDAAAAAFVCS